MVVSAGAEAQSNPSSSDNQPHVDPVYSDSLPPPPDALRGLQNRYDAGQRALDGADDPHRLAVPVSRSVSVSLAPGAQTNIIRIAQDYPASITFLDSTGQPWPISWNITTNKAGGCGKDGDQNAGGSAPSVRAVGINACVPEAGSNVLQLTPVSRYASGGVLVSLKGAPKPINFMIVAGTGSYDADLTARVMAQGPNAKEALSIDNTPVTGAPVMTAMLDGAPPADAVPLVVSGVGADTVRAWKFGHAMYLRTTYGLVSPAPTAKESEYDMTVYAIPETPRVLLTAAGRMIGITLSEDGP